jgi:ferredoxin--NADP+ reductase
MTYVITQSCLNDTSCVDVCPVDAIHPRPDEPGYETSDLVYIDPVACIDCGACERACPIGAVYAEDDLPESLQGYLQINADHFAGQPPAPVAPAQNHVAPSDRARLPELRVAIVGSGPAGCYAADALLARKDVRASVHMYERLPSPWGLVRSGVAPDHPQTKTITDLFTRVAEHPDVQFNLAVEVGQHITHDELLKHHHAVIYAVGAPRDRRLGIPGEDLPGSHPAAEFVAWYNGHPDHADRTYDFACSRAVIVGNGNVALDMARILLADADALARTDIGESALAQLRASEIREVVVLGRRGPDQAAYTAPELLGLEQLAGVDIVVDPADASPDTTGTPSGRLKAEILAQWAARTPSNDRRIVLRYLSSPVEIHGTDHVRAVEVVRNEMQQQDDGSVLAMPTNETELIETGLVLRSIGYRADAIAGVPFDAERGVLPNDAGRVLDLASDRPEPGVYATGWIKRGPSGVIGTNRRCAQETVSSLVDDFQHGRLPAPSLDSDALERLLEGRAPNRFGVAGWHAIDAHERRLGVLARRPRVKLTARPALMEVAAQTARGDRPPTVSSVTDGAAASALKNDHTDGR